MRATTSRTPFLPSSTPGPKGTPSTAPSFLLSTSRQDPGKSHLLQPTSRPSTGQPLPPQSGGFPPPPKQILTHSCTNTTITTDPLLSDTAITSQDPIHQHPHPLPTNCRPAHTEHPEPRPLPLRRLTDEAGPPQPLTSPGRGGGGAAPHSTTSHRPPSPAVPSSRHREPQQHRREEPHGTAEARAGQRSPAAAAALGTPNRPGRAGSRGAQRPRYARPLAASAPRAAPAARGAPRSPPARGPPRPGPPRGGSRSARGLLLTRSPPGSSPRALSAAPFFRPGPAPPTPRAGGRDGGRKGRRRRRGAAGPGTGLGCARPAAARAAETPESPRAATRLPAHGPLPPRPAAWFGPPGADWHGAPHTRAQRWYGPPPPTAPPGSAHSVPSRGGPAPARAVRGAPPSSMPRVRASRAPSRASGNRRSHPSALGTPRTLPARQPALVLPVSPPGASLRPVQGGRAARGRLWNAPLPLAVLGPVLPHHVRRGLSRRHPPAPRGGGTALPPPARWFCPHGGSHGFRGSEPRRHLATSTALTIKKWLESVSASCSNPAWAPKPRSLRSYRQEEQKPRHEPRPRAGMQPRAPLLWAVCDRPGTGTRAPLCSACRELQRGPSLPFRRTSICTSHNIEPSSPPGPFCS